MDRPLGAQPLGEGPGARTRICREPSDGGAGAGRAARRVGAIAFAPSESSWLLGAVPLLASRHPRGRPIGRVDRIPVGVRRSFTVPGTTGCRWISIRSVIGAGLGSSLRISFLRLIPGGRRVRLPGGRIVGSVLPCRLRSRLRQGMTAAARLGIGLVGRVAPGAQSAISRSPGRRPSPCATGCCPVGRLPDRVGSSFGWVLPGRGIAIRPLPRLIHRRRLTVLCWSQDDTAPAPRLRVSLPQCRSSPWRPPAAMPTSPTYPAGVRLEPPGLRTCVVVVPVRQGACSGIRPCALHGPAVLHRVAD